VGVDEKVESLWLSDSEAVVEGLFCDREIVTDPAVGGRCDELAKAWEVVG
jgi:hypothetical protein